MIQLNERKKKERNTKTQRKERKKAHTYICATKTRQSNGWL